MYRITEYLAPRRTTHTSYGVISNHQWLLYEKTRFEAIGKECTIVPDKHGNESLFCTGIEYGGDGYVGSTR